MEKNIQMYWENEIKPQLEPLHNAAGNLLYYVFQTPYRFQPELLIVGINPGGGYEGIPFLARETNWYTDGKKNAEHSHSFNETLCAVFGYGKNDKLFDLLENAVGTNMIFFNTGSVNKLKNNSFHKEMETKCVKIVRNLSDNFIQPKRILCLGVPPFYGMKNSKDVECPIKGIAIKKSYRGNTPVYYIPNPSKRNINKYYTSDQIAQIQDFFQQEFLN